jgi:hypothetical protein
MCREITTHSLATAPGVPDPAPRLVFTPAVSRHSEIRFVLSAELSLYLIGRTLDPRRYAMRSGRPKATELIPFYAMREDILPVLEAVESDGALA